MRLASTVRSLGQLSCTTGALWNNNAVVLAVQTMHKVGRHLVRLGTVIAFLCNALDLVVGDDTTGSSLILLLPVLTNLGQQISIDDVFVLSLAHNLVILVCFTAWQH